MSGFCVHDKSQSLLAKSMLVSFVGDDEIGKRVLESLTHCGIDTRFVKVVKGHIFGDFVYSFSN